jgi:CrcB protein
MSEADGRSSVSSDEGEAEEAGTRRAGEADEAPTRRSHVLERLEPVLLVAVGGFTGAICRHAVAVLLPGGFPWGTLAVNVAGSFALGVLLFEAKLAGRLSAETRLVLGTGFLSSFTTYSTFAVQTAALSPTLAVANVAANYALGFAAVLVGRAVVRSFANQGVAG